MALPAPPQPKRPWVGAIAIVAFVASATAANAQRADRTVGEHIAIARAAAYRPGQDFIDVFETLCGPAMSEEGPREPGLQVAPSLAERRVPPRLGWYAEPGKVFDNLYYVGSTGDSIWAVTTSEGIIVVDTGYDYSIEELTNGLKIPIRSSARTPWIAFSRSWASVQMLSWEE